MPNPTPNWIVFLACSALSACGGGGGNGGTGPNLDTALEASCQTHCDTATVPECTSTDRDTCLINCRRTVTGLETNCGICVVEIGSPLRSQAGVCAGGTVGGIDWLDCETACVGVTHPGTIGDIDEHCLGHCNVTGISVCTADDAATCLTNCQAATDGLTFGCAICLIEVGKSLYPYSNACAGGTLGAPDWIDCTNFCTDG